MDTPFPRKTTRAGIRCRSRGFSLVEVALALGIFAFGIIATVGLIPIALQTHLDARIETIRAQIHQRLAAEALLTDYAKIDQLNGKLRYFDAEGLEVFEPHAPNAGRPIIFTSKMVVAPASIPAAYLAGSMKKVTFYALHDPARRGVPAAAKPTGSILVPKTGPEP